MSTADPQRSLRLFRTRSGPVVQRDGRFQRIAADWENLLGEDGLFERLSAAEARGDGRAAVEGGLLAPIAGQEVWACGVTYTSSRLARMEESKAAGGGDFYARVYHAERPEIFFKATAARVAGSGEAVRIRRDSSWDVPEPELTLVLSATGAINGYTIGNDMSSRSIEGENPLYLPQAKTWERCAGLGPCILVTDTPLGGETAVEMEIRRGGGTVFSGRTTLAEMKRRPEELAAWLFRELAFPHGVFLMTGTGIVPGADFTLEPGDEVRIIIEPIGTLLNRVERLSS
ncbi:MAG: 2-hydroxyhepta-2,4-diene-1,7-dioate isomerase [Puniceicoccaceae bacterium]|nr:MAG: 2-hydroxyhepta-2,4-diene-1,7-dioate isomerase [Puniceicoccaceae bacterium]